MSGIWLEGVERRESRHCNARPAGVPVTLLVVHNVSLPAGQFGTGCPARLFTGRLDCGEHPDFESLKGLRVAPHLLVERDGHVIQFVGLEARAWHAGVSSHGGRQGCNDFSVGIEVEGCDFAPFDDRQYPALARLIRSVVERVPTIVDVAGHNDIAPGRKTDPGPYFDWERLIAEPDMPPGLRYPYRKDKGGKG